MVTGPLCARALAGSVISGVRASLKIRVFHKQKFRGLQRICRASVCPRSASPPPRASGAPANVERAAALAFAKKMTRLLCTEDSVTLSATGGCQGLGGVTARHRIRRLGCVPRRAAHGVAVGGWLLDGDGALHCGRTAQQQVPPAAAAPAAAVAATSADPQLPCVERRPSRFFSVREHVRLNSATGRSAGLSFGGEIVRSAFFLSLRTA